MAYDISGPTIKRVLNNTCIQGALRSVIVDTQVTVHDFTHY